LGEAPPVSGYPDEVVQFPYYLQRIHPTGTNGAIAGLRELDAIYDGPRFMVEDGRNTGADVWYATNETRASPLDRRPAALVSYKGAVFKVLTIREIYDSEPKTILLSANWYVPYPWGGPDSVDLERLADHH
jgi:hypothetical protein